MATFQLPGKKFIFMYEKIENQFSWCKNISILSYALFFGMGAIKEKLNLYRAIYEDRIQKLFKNLGSFLSKHPRKTLICCIIVNILLALGILNIEFQYDVETLYIPEDSKSLKDRNNLEALYGDPTGSNFAPYQLTRQGLYGDVLIVSKDKSSIMKPLYINEINSIDAFIREKILVEDSEMRKFRHRDICALGRSGCVVVGSILLSPKFQSDFVTGNVTFPVYNKISLNSLLAKPVSHGGVLVNTIGVRLRYYLRQNTTNASKLSKDWAKVFIKTMKTFHTNLTEIAFSHSDSLSEELDNIKESATIYFIITLLIMVVYALISSATFNCNNVANRMNLAFAGIFASLLSIVSSFGLVMACGLEFTTVAGVIPFLIIGIGIDDMFILLSGMAGAPPLYKSTVEERMAFMLKKGGVAITITSVTDMIAFIIGASAVFVSIKIFCIYTAVAVFFCYLNQLFILCPAIAINECRTEQKRHFCCCTQRVKSKEIYKRKSKSRCFIQCFAGHQPKSREDVESPLEKYPKRLISLILRYKPGKLIVAVVFLAYIVSSIYGALNLKQGLDVHNLVSKDSYYYTYGVWDTTYFTSDPMVTVCITNTHQYHTPQVQNQIRSLILTVKKDDNIDDHFAINWLAVYKESAFYNSTSENAFVKALREFLQSPQGQMFSNDVVLDETTNTIRSSKIHLRTVNLKTNEEQGDLMLRIREIEKHAPVQIIIFSPIFTLCEQYIQILSTTLQTVGITLAVVLLVKYFFMPNIVVGVVVAMTLVSIIVGIFGFMYYLDLSLNSMTMIHLVMSVGFSVDFSVHICHAFLSLKSNDRDKVLEEAIDATGGPILNAAFSSMLGVAILIISDSYAFLCFGKVMFLVLGLGLLHACLFLPLFLYILMPWIIPKKNAVEPENVRVELNYLETFTIYDPRLFRSELSLNNYSDNFEELEFDSSSVSSGIEHVSPNQDEEKQ